MPWRSLIAEAAFRACARGLRALWRQAVNEKEKALREANRGHETDDRRASGEQKKETFSERLSREGKEKSQRLQRLVSQKRPELYAEKEKQKAEPSGQASGPPDQNP